MLMNLLDNDREDLNDIESVIPYLKRNMNIPRGKIWATHSEHTWLPENWGNFDVGVSLVHTSDQRTTVAMEVLK
jgi:hypothetical protein